MCNHWLQALKVEAAVAQPLMPQPLSQAQPQPQLQPLPLPLPQADTFADAQAQVLYQRARAQRAQAEYERLKDIFAQADGVQGGARRHHPRYRHVVVCDLTLTLTPNHPRYRHVVVCDLPTCCAS